MTSDRDIGVVGLNAVQAIGGAHDEALGKQSVGYAHFGSGDLSVNYNGCRIENIANSFMKSSRNNSFATGNTFKKFGVGDERIGCKAHHCERGYGCSDSADFFKNN